MGKTAKEEMITVEAALDEFETSSQLPINIYPGSDEELDEILNMDTDHIIKLSCLECGAISFRLARYSLYIQRLYNRDMAKKTWAEAAIVKAAASCWKDYSDYIKYDIKIALIAKENEYVNKLNSIISYATQRTQRMEYLSAGVKHMSDILIRQQQYKKKANEYE